MMGTEIELKLAAPPSVLRKAMHTRWLTKAATERVNRRQLTSIYFDTPDFALRNHDFTLRVRKSDTTNLQTIKATGTDIVQRDEWEDEIDGDRPKLSLARHTALAPLLSHDIEKELRPVFETSVERVVMPLRFGRSDIELAFDRGRIHTSDHHLNISEFEIELKNGDRRDIAMLARRLAKAFPVAYGERSKAQRGYALLEGTLADAISARPVQVDPAMTTADAFMTIGFECLRHVTCNEIAVRRSDPEGIHQMRVGLRRLRAASSLFKEMLHDRETHRIKLGLVWLTEQLGPARDYEVMLSESIDPLLEQQPDRTDLRLLQSNFKGERDRGYAIAKAAVASPRYREIVLDTALWLLDGEWRRNHDALRTALRELPVPAFVRDELKRRARKIAKRVSRLEALDPRRRHKLRIAVKKTRYACEFFEVPIVRDVGKKRARKFDRSLKDLQGSLGKLNDIAVHARLASEFTQSSKASQRAFAVGYLVGQESAASKRLLADATQAGKRMQKAVMF
jgi:inorganic triphosphatase YgiF